MKNKPKASQENNDQDRDLGRALASFVVDLIFYFKAGLKRVFNFPSNTKIRVFAN